MENTEIKNNPSTPEPQQKPTRLSDFFDWQRYFKLEVIGNNLTYILFLGVIATFYIWNTYQSEKMVRSIDQTSKELKQLRWEYMSTQSELMYESKQSEVAKKVEAQGLKELRNPPKKIVARRKQQ